jgi:hypothetical protein
VTEKLVQADLDLEGLIFVLVVDVLVGCCDEGDGLLWRGSAEDVAE